MLLGQFEVEHGDGELARPQRHFHFRFGTPAVKLTGTQRY
jgi:hypothetical protein